MFPPCVVGPDTLGLCTRAGPRGTPEAQERWTVLLRPVQAFTSGDTHVLRCQERTESRPSLSLVVF